MRIVLVLLIIACLGCTPSTSKKNENKEDSNDGTKVIKTTYSNGKPKAEVSYKDGKRNGLSKSFDKEGKISLELPYLNNKREGKSKKYYEGGHQLYQTTEYKDDLIHGMQIKYRENGDVLSEAQYEKNFPCLNLKEFYKDNTLKKEKDYPKIIVTPIDRLDSQGVYILEISMSEKVRKVKYYTGKLTSTGCISNDLYSILLNEKNKTGKLSYNLGPGGFMMEELNIIAVVETSYGNSYITQRKYNLAIDN
jgi:antitoxin component YwqK of YwqJK toxin-antitoxin module